MISHGSLPIPTEVWERLRAFLDAGKTGSVTLEIKDGMVLSWKVTEAGRIHRVDKKA